MTGLDPSGVLVVLPTYNEMGNIGPMVAAIRSHGFRVLVVDDGSPDGTGDAADGLAEADDSVGVLHREAKEGLGRAYAAGFGAAIASSAHVVCEMDADFSHDPADLPRLVAGIEAGADVVLGSRYVPGGNTQGWPWHRRLISRGGNTYARWVLGLRVADATGGFRAFSRDALEALDPGTCESSGYAFQVEMIQRARNAGLEVREVPIVFRERERGESKMSSAIAFEAMRLVTRWGWDRLRGARSF